MNRLVVMVSSQYPPVYGGAGSQAQLVSKRLVSRGWGVHVVTLDQNKMGSTSQDGITVTRVLRGIAAKNSWTRLITTLGLSIASGWVIVSTRPNIVHVHGAYWWTIIPVLAAKAVRAGSIVKSTRDGEDDAKTVFGKRFGPIPVGLIYGLSLRMASAVIVLNKDAKLSADEAGLADKTRLIRNGVDLDTFHRSPQRRTSARAKEGLSETDRVVLFVGYLAKHKGVQDLVDVWRSLADKRTHLWLVGPATGFYRELDDRIPQEIADLKADGFLVREFGHIAGTELPMLYWAADVFVLPSYAEGMPNSLAEAIVSGCQIVATSIPGITEIVGAEEASLFAAGDLKGFAHALSESILKHQGSAPVAAAKLGIDYVASSYEDLYQQIAIKR